MGTSKNSGRDAYDGERRATFVARSFGAQIVLFKSGSGSKAEPCAGECQTFDKIARVTALLPQVFEWAP